MKRTLYQDKYNSNKVWEVTMLSHGIYLRKYICGKQFGRGRRISRKELKSIGILDMKQIDKMMRLDKVVTICYRQKRIWSSRDDAIKFYTEGVMMSEGSEKDRYMNVLLKLQAGKNVCTDDD